MSRSHWRTASGLASILLSISILLVIRGKHRHPLPPRVQGSLSRSMNCAYGSKNLTFATLYSSPTACYTLALGIFLSTFRAEHSSYRVLVLHDATIDIPDELAGLAGNAAEFRSIPRIVDYSVVLRLQAMATKFQLWTLECFDAVAYFDADHVFVGNPDGIFDACRGAPFCAVPDVSPSSKRARQFNAGAMVIEPSTKFAKELLEAYRARYLWMNKKDLRRSGDQIFLNHFIRNWRVMPSTYNAQHGKQGIVMHDKVWKNKSGAFVDSMISSPFLKDLLLKCQLEQVREVSKMT